MIGIGDANWKLAVYIGNRPPLDEFTTLNEIIPANVGDLSRVGQSTSNHWRKIINIYAKLTYSLKSQCFDSWQVYRDNYLLSESSGQALLFNQYTNTQLNHRISLICGKTYAAEQVDTALFDLVDDDFAINNTHKTIITPYFDYRQLSNLKIDKLVKLIKNMQLL